MENSNRTIKFRAWDKRKEIMIGVSSIYFFQGGIKIEAPGHDIGGEANAWVYLNDNFKENEQTAIMMQYTGLKDKNGKEIYESDICKIGNKTVCISWDNENAKFVNIEVKFGDKFKLDESQSPKDHKELEIIGNIYE